MLVDGHRADAVGRDVAARRVLDVLDVTADVGLDGGILEHAVAGLVERAVLQHQAVGVAQQLLAGQVAVHQPYVLRVPGQILAVKLGVVDGHVLALPERVLGQYLGVVNLYVLAVLEDILGVALQTVDVDVLREHERVGAAVQADVLQAQAVDAPEGLVGVAYLHVFQLYVAHLAEELRAVDAAAAHHQVVAVPDGRPRALGEVAVFNQCAVDVPPRVFAVEAAVLCLHVLALLDAALAVGDGDVFKSQVVHGEQWALAAEFFVLYQFHEFINTMIFMAKVQKRFDTCNFFRTFAAELKQTTS